MDPLVYRQFTQAALDAAYDNRAHVPTVESMRPGWAARSAALYANRRVARDLAYGPGARERLDYFYADRPGRPTLAYIHGGYWQWNDKEPNAYVAEGPLALGLNVAVIEYTLTPQTTMDGIVEEIRRAMRFLVPQLVERFEASDRLVVTGHSAGGHLAAIAMESDGVTAALPISGLFDLEPVRLTAMNRVLGLDAASARRNSPMLRRPRKVPAIVAYGDAELPELQRHSAEYAAYLRSIGHAASPLALDGKNHFTILEELAHADGRLARAALDLAEKA